MHLQQLDKDFEIKLEKALNGVESRQKEFSSEIKANQKALVSHEDAISKLETK